MRFYHKISEIITSIIRSQRAINYATKKSIPGLQFAQYGRQLGIRLLWNRLPGGGYLLRPVSITRYFEFDFALNCLPSDGGICLDISSPRLFSYYVAEKKLANAISIFNPDAKDARLTEKIAVGLAMRNISITCTDVKTLINSSEIYDNIWSISVIEHISGKYDDTYAIRLMYNALKKGGFLILTFPVDRQFWEEYRDGQDPYGTQEKSEGDKYFFQRFYDFESIQHRLLQPIGATPITMRWFGENTPGHFQKYDQNVGFEMGFNALWTIHEK
jgi:SAM-dependent methyltransferase